MSGIAIGGGGGGGFNPQPPTSVVTGSGSYTVPAGKYGHLQANATVGTGASGTGSSTNSGAAGGGGGSANSSSQWIIAGDSITTISSYPNIGPTLFNNFSASTASAYSRVLLNGSNFCTASSSSQSMGYSYRAVTSSGALGWSVALFDV